MRYINRHLHYITVRNIRPKQATYARLAQQATDGHKTVKSKTLVVKPVIQAKFRPQYKQNKKSNVFTWLNTN